MSSSLASFQERVYAIVRKVPRGRVITYGAIAQVLGEPGKARQVGWAMAATPDTKPRIPWHRVINARGEISQRHAPAAEDLQRKRLEAEAIVFGADGRVDLEHYLWLPRVSGRHAATRKQARDADHDDRAEYRDEQAR